MLELDQHGPAALLTIARPARKNAMDAAFFAELPRALDELAVRPGVRGIVVTGAGDAFSAGGDFNAFDELHEPTDHRRWMDRAYGAFRAVERCELPVIAAVNGVAYGGGAELTLACDTAVASERARFAFREATLGLMPGYGLVRGPATIGRGWTLRLAMTADVLSADEAMRCGLVQEVVPHEQLLATAIGIVERIAAVAPLAVSAAKKLVNGANDHGLAESAEATARLFTTRDHRRAVEAFLAKEPIDFQGR